MKYEQLNPNLIIPLLEERLEELKETLKKLNSSYSKQSLKDYSLRIAQKNGHPDYYCVNKNTSPAGKYIPRNEKAFAQQLAQKDYDINLINLLHKEIKAI